MSRRGFALCRGSSCARGIGVFFVTGIIVLGSAPPAWADGLQGAGDKPVAAASVAKAGQLPAPPGTDEVKALIAKAGDAAKHNADAVVVMDVTDVLIRPSGIGTARSHVVTKILREPAIRSQAVQRFEFDPQTNRLDLVAIRVYRADGKIEEIPVASKIQQPQPAAGIFWGTQQYLVPLPRLAVGDAVETIAAMTGFNVAYLDDEETAAITEQQRQAAAAQTSAGGASKAQAKAESAVVVGSAVSNTVSDGPEELNALGQPLKPPVPGHWHDEVHFWSGTPVILKRYTVRAPKEKPLQYEIYGGELRTSAMLDGDWIVYTFEKKDIAPFKDEPSMESAPNVATKLLLATLPTWEMKSKWLHSVSEPQLAADDAIKAKVAEIIKDCKTDEEKWTALDHWVAENIRYSGTSRGMCEGYTIHKSTETFRDRCGVCKDKAGMLTTMLRVAGFDAYTVMTMARQRVDRIPADQFNHCVTCIKHKDGSLMLLDPTWMPRSRDNWSTLEPLQHVVYGIPEGKELSMSPDYPPEQNLASWKAETELRADNDVCGTFSFTANGAPETRLRRALAGYDPTDRPRLFQETALRLAPNTTVTKIECMDPVDFSGPVTASVGFEADGFALGTGPRRYFALPMLQTMLGDRVMADMLDKTGPKERKYALRLSATRLAKFDETIKLPAGWEVAKKPDAVDIDGPSAALHFRIETVPAKGGEGAAQIHYTCDLAIKRWTIPPEEYANFKEVMEEFTELTGRVMVCTTKADGGKAEDGHAQR